MENMSSAPVTVLAECSMPFLSLPLILKSCPLGRLLSRRAEALNPNGLFAYGDSPLAPDAQDGLHAQPGGTDTVELSGN